MPQFPKNEMRWPRNMLDHFGHDDQIVEHLERKFGIKTGESTEDGKFYLKREEECLAACCGAPMMMVDHVYHENLTPEKVDAVLEKLE